VSSEETGHGEAFSAAHAGADLQAKPVVYTKSCGYNPPDRFGLQGSFNLRCRSRNGWKLRLLSQRMISISMHKLTAFTNHERTGKDCG
jgi:hypothetical protein